MKNADSADHTILVAQDGSPGAQAAANVAIQIAKGRDLSIYGLYVVDEVLALDPYANYGPELGRSAESASREDLIAWSREQGDAALRWLQGRCQAAGVPVTTELVAGGIPELLLGRAAQAQLLALGRRGHGHADAPHHLGRSFRAIAHHAHSPLLVGGDDDRTVRRLLLAYDGSDRAQSALAWTSILQRSLTVEVLVVAVQERESDPSGRWLEEAQERLPGSSSLLRQGQPATEISAAAEENQADLIVMGRYSHPAVLEWLAGSTVDRVLRNAQPAALLV
jgi:nucleotide-binding universal stress UspA family protein